MPKKALARCAVDACLGLAMSSSQLGTLTDESTARSEAPHTESWSHSMEPLELPARIAAY